MLYYLLCIAFVHIAGLLVNEAYNKKLSIGRYDYLIIKGFITHAVAIAWLAKEINPKMADKPKGTALQSKLFYRLN